MEFFGGRTRTRTWDPLIKSQLLYQLSYAPGMPPRWTPQGLRPVAKRVPAVQRRPVETCLKISLPRSSPRGAPRDGKSAFTRLCDALCVAGTPLRGPRARRSGLEVPGLASLARDTKSWIPAGVYPRESGGGNERSSWRALAICSAQHCGANAQPHGYFTTARRGFHKRKAAGWGPGGSRTSAIVSGGWECDRRR